MKTLNQLISDYTCLLQQGVIQVAYKGILAFLGRLRADMIKEYPHYEIGSIYQGYMDMSYFSLTTKSLKDKGLKIAVVYLHEKGTFEVWLSARNRTIAKQYEFVFDSNASEMALFHEENNPDAIVECTLLSIPDFNDQAALINMIGQGVNKFISIISDTIS